MTISTHGTAEDTETGRLAPIAERVSRLSTAMIHHVNRVRPNPAGLKMGGRQASSAFLVSIMTTSRFHLRAQDRVRVTPHASPVLRATNDRATAPGVTGFGQTGTLDEVFRSHGLDAGSIVSAVLDRVG